MKRRFLMVLFALPFAFGFASMATPGGDYGCSTPSNVVSTGKTGGSASFSWDAVPGATAYVVKYERLSDGYKSQEWSKTSTSHTFTGLTPGAYKFSFASVCGGEASGFIVIDDISGT